MEEVFDMGKALQAAGHHAKAEECYRRYLEDHEDSFKALNNLGVVLECQDKLGEAVECFRKASALVPHDSIPRYNLAHAFMRQERLDSAASLFEEVLEKEPDHEAARLNLATIHWRQDRLADAEGLLREACSEPAASARAHSKLGLLLFDTGRFADARTCHLEACRLEDESPLHHFHVALCEKLLGNHAAAGASLTTTVRLDPSSRIAHEHRVRAYVAAGQHDDAQAALEEWAAALPGDPVCAHIAAALRADPDKERCDADYVRDTFGAFANDYDETMARLGYGAPDVIAARLGRDGDSDTPRFDRVLDAGCGTGLCGPAVRPHARTLLGVDLAEPMLAQARQRGHYDDLATADLVDYLDDIGEDERFDLIVAADTLIYFGELGTVCRAAHAALRDGGQFLFTLEAGGEETETYTLMPNGRFCHARDYVVQVLRDAGFATPEFESFVVRNETGKPVQSWLIHALRS